MLDRRDTLVKGKTYSIIPPPPLQGLPLCTRTAILLGPTLGKLGPQIQLALKSDGLEQLIGPMMASLGSALQETDPDKASKLLVDAAFASKLTCDGEPICSQAAFERHFSSYRDEMYQILVWCLWEVTKDFFPGAETFLRTAKAAAQESASRSPKAGQTTGG